MCTSIGDIFNSVNKCENGAPYISDLEAIYAINVRLIQFRPKEIIWRNIKSYIVNDSFNNLKSDNQSINHFIADKSLYCG